MSRTAPLVFGLASFLALTSGCNNDDSDSGPTDQQVLLVQRSAAASGAFGQVVEASNSEIVASGSASQGAFNFSASVDLLIGLDSTDTGGHDRFPNASGQIHVTASGAVTNTSLSGDASYAVAVAAETDVLVTNPDRGVQGLYPAGFSWSFQLNLE